MDATNPPPPLPPGLASAQYFIRITQIHFCAMYAVMVWDSIVCFRKEYKLIWKSEWSIVKVVYLLCRWWPISVVPFVLWCFVNEEHTVEQCLKLYRAPVALAMWNQLWAEIILLIRTHAFLGQSRLVLVFLCTCLSGVIAYQLYVDANKLLLLPFLTPSAPYGKGPCFPMAEPGSAHVLGFFLAPLGYDSIVTFMTFWRVIQIRRQGGSASPIFQTFWREGIQYFVLISIANLINGIFYLQPRQEMSALNIPLSIMFPNILACRLVLDLRGMAAKEGSRSGSGGSNPRTLTGLAFSSRTGAKTSGRLESNTVDISRGEINTIELLETRSERDHGKGGVHVVVESETYDDDSNRYSKQPTPLAPV